MDPELESRLQKAPVIPLIAADEPGVAVDIAKALVAGGLTVLEVVLRTDSALECLARVDQSVPDGIVGAGTVLSPAQAEAALAAGARFIVSPGLYPPVVDTCLSANVDVFPGIATPSEAQNACNLGLRTMKFFPADQMGGVGMLKALSAVVRDARFIPTGGIAANNLADFLEVPSVLACGGSWLSPKAHVVQRQFDEITRLANEALAVAAKVRK